MIATIAGMQATAGMKATTLLQLYHLHRRDTNNSTSNSRDPNNSMVAINSEFWEEIC
jgi:hypothetical protein